MGFGVWKAYAVQNSKPIVGNMLDWVIALVITNLYVHTTSHSDVERVKESFLSQDDVAESVQNTSGMSPMAFHKCLRKEVSGSGKASKGLLGLAS